MSGTFSILTHGLELTDQLLLGPLGPLLLVRIDGTQDRTAWLPAILNGWNIQVMDEHDVGVLRVKTGRGCSQIRLFCQVTNGLPVPKIELN